MARNSTSDPRVESVGIVGAGMAGMITAQTLLQDGFLDVQLLTRDRKPGGVWSAERVYPGLYTNNVHGEFRFSPLAMAPPDPAQVPDGRLSGRDMQTYMETFAERFLTGKIRHSVEVLDIRRDEETGRWQISIEDLTTGSKSMLSYTRIVVCTGGCSTPFVPDELSPLAAKSAGFKGPVFHSLQFRSELEELLSEIAPASPGEGSVVLVGCGKSAQDIAAYLAKHDRTVKVVFEKTDAFLAGPKPLPEFVRKSRLLAVFSPHIELRTRLERFLHTTWLGNKLVSSVWSSLQDGAFQAMSLGKASPLRQALPPYWNIRTNDEGVPRADGFHVLVNSGKIGLVSPARVERYGHDGQSVVLSTGEVIQATAVILCTGYTSSWDTIFTDQTCEELGLKARAAERIGQWDYPTLSTHPPESPGLHEWSPSLYRGIVPAKNIMRRDFAVNGALLTANNGYAFEVVAHWISSYFLQDRMRLPGSVEEALVQTELNAAWLRKRYPAVLSWKNPSYTGSIAFWTWPQTIDDLLEDMRVRSLRSGGGWMLWPFSVIDLSELATLGEERRSKRQI